MTRRALRPILLLALAGVLATTGCSRSVDILEADPSPTPTRTSVDDTIAGYQLDHPDLAFDSDQTLEDGVGFEFVPDFRASQGWREVEVTPRTPGTAGSSSGSYALEDESCTVEWSVTPRVQTDNDITASAALLDSLAGVDDERGESTLSVHRLDGSLAGNLQVVTALSLENTSYIWARDMDGLQFTVAADCTTREATLTTYSVVHESLPIVFTRPGEEDTD